MNSKMSARLQKLLWHLQWILLVAVIVYNIVVFLNGFELNTYLVVHGISGSCLLLLKQFEKFFECKANCTL